jgi:hypothetical protein
VPGLTGHDLGNHHALFHRLVGEHRASNHITNGVNARLLSLKMPVDRNASSSATRLIW